MAITERYVTTTGAGAHDGTSEGNAFSWAEMVSDLNAGGRAGYRYNVKQGTYSRAGTLDTLTGDGSTTAPIIIRGYKTTIGDATLGRLTTGALDTSNMPTVTYNSSGLFYPTGSTHLVVESIILISANPYYAFASNTNAVIHNCSISCTSANVAASCIEVAGTETSIINCDLTNSGTTGSYAVEVKAVYCVIHGCRITSAGHGIALTSSSAATITGNVIFSCPTSGIYVGTTAKAAIIGNTIYACGNGVEYVSGGTGLALVVGNHITDCTGYAVDYNANTEPRILIANRTRDNASGIADATSDWRTALELLGVTTDSGNYSTDYADAPGGDFSLLSTAAGIGRGLMPYTDLGAVGAPRTASGLKGYASA